MHEITLVLYNEERHQRRVLKFRGAADEIKVAAFDAQVAAQGEGFFLVSAKIEAV